MARLVPADGGVGGAVFLEDFSEASFAVDMYLRATDDGAMDGVGGKEDANEARERWLLGRLASTGGEFELSGAPPQGYYAQGAGIASDSATGMSNSTSNSNGGSSSSSNDDDDYVDGDDDDSEDSASLFYAGPGAEGRLLHPLDLPQGALAAEREDDERDPGAAEARLPGLREKPRRRRRRHDQQRPAKAQRRELPAQARGGARSLRVPARTGEDGVHGALLWRGR